MSDSIRRFLFEGAPIRGEIVQLDATWRAVLERHAYPPLLRRLLGELMAASALLAATLKFDGAMVMQVQGTGALKLLVVECTSAGTLRATAKWDALPEDAGFAELFDQARCVITLVQADGSQSYQGVVEVLGDSVSEMLMHYMRHSEQIETTLLVSADDRRAAGLLLQRLPDVADGDADRWDRLRILAGTVEPDELLELPAPDIIRRLFHEEDVRVFESQPLAFRCSCSKERVESMLKMLGPEEVESVLAEQGMVEVTCEFCNRAYRFDRVDSAQLFSGGTRAPGTPTRH
ncbi:MAG: Hsp33 family molecular chaperone HslO [Proteobacteria bacterium]|nr:Hsp33 family molecular chaperone HslO [Burkholderiales bacterium]